MSCYTSDMTYQLIVKCDTALIKRVWINVHKKRKERKKRNAKTNTFMLIGVLRLALVQQICARIKFYVYWCVTVAWQTRLFNVQRHLHDNCNLILLVYRPALTPFPAALVSIQNRSLVLMYDVKQIKLSAKGREQ